MIDISLENEKPLYAFLVGRAESKQEDNLEELTSLIDTAGFTPCGKIILKRNEPSPKFGIGSGKAKDIINDAKNLDAEFIIFDFEISPSHQRNWEKESGLTCLDRQEVIIQIFAQRALTKEAVLQVELARLEYSLPRLMHTYEALSRQRGGRYGTKGSGETQLELDRRSILERIAHIKKELILVRKNRATQRKQRERTPIPSCAIVGYTNVGKSSLLNTMTGAAVLAENKLFATLDPTTRKYNLPSGKSILLTDTVGFIKKLPHNLVDAFYATLEEAAFSEVLLLVLDASAPDIELQLETTFKVLKEIDAEDHQKIIVFNKTDSIDSFKKTSVLTQYPNSIFVSAHTKEGIEELALAIEEALSGEESEYKIPTKRSDLVAYAHRDGIVLSLNYVDDFIFLKAKAKGKLASSLESYKINKPHEIKEL